MELGLTGKTVLITGASGGIGRGLVLGFAAEGANVVLASRDETQTQSVADAAKDLPGQTLVVKSDVTKPEIVEQTVAAARDAFGEVDVLVNNAGGVYYPREFLDKPRDEWEWEVDLNVWGVVNCTKAVGQTMVERGSGSIVNITSNSSLVPEAANQVANYAGTKGYVNSLSMALAYEWGPKGVRVNCIAPGWIVPWEQDHAGDGSFWKKYGYDFFGTPEAMAEAAAKGEELFNISSQPIRRVGRPEDIANAALFFASDVSSFMTGQLVSVSGGAYMA